MAPSANVLPKLRAADLGRFITRAAQLEQVKPVVAYWCEYWIVNQILAKGLHNGDSETLQYTMTLMDKLEQIKAENADNPAVIEDAAGQAYVEEFASQTFERADRAVLANKVTRQTADTFSAAATFFELTNIWATPDPDSQAKIRYAKWNAVRIATALKEGKDPNETNPRPLPVEEELPALDPNDPEVQALGRPIEPMQAFVEDVPDEQDQLEQRLARQSSIDRSLHPSAQGSGQVSARESPRISTFDPYPRDGFPYTAAQDDNVSPLESSPRERNGSLGGGYFPEVPTTTSDYRPAPSPPSPSDLDLPDTSTLSAPGGEQKSTPDFESFPPPNLSDDVPPPPMDLHGQRYAPETQTPPSQQNHYSPHPTNSPPSVLDHYPPPQTNSRPQSSQSRAPPAAQRFTAPQRSSYPQSTPNPYSQPPTPQTPQYPQHNQQPPQQFQPPVGVPAQQYQPAQNNQALPQSTQNRPLQSQMQAPRSNAQLNTDDVAVAKAQKHARWAISALNFEDAETAVKELKAALETLGAR